MITFFESIRGAKSTRYCGARSMLGAKIRVVDILQRFVIISLYPHVNRLFFSSVHYSNFAYHVCLHPFLEHRFVFHVYEDGFDWSANTTAFLGEMEGFWYRCVFFLF